MAPGSSIVVAHHRQDSPGDTPARPLREVKAWRIMNGIDLRPQRNTFECFAPKPKLQQGRCGQAIGPYSYRLIPRKVCGTQISHAHVTRHKHRCPPGKYAPCQFLQMAGGRARWLAAFEFWASKFGALGQQFTPTPDQPSSCTGPSEEIRLPASPWDQ